MTFIDGLFPLSQVGWTCQVIYLRARLPGTHLDAASHQSPSLSWPACDVIHASHVTERCFRGEQWRHLEQQQQHRSFTALVVYTIRGFVFGRLCHDVRNHCNVVQKWLRLSL